MTNREEIRIRAKIEILEEIFQNCFQEDSKTFGLVEDYLSELRHQAMLGKGGLTKEGGEALVKDLFHRFIKADMNNQTIAEDIGVTRERVRQIYEKVFGEKGFSYLIVEEVDWVALKGLVKELGITREELSERAKISDSTASNILSEDKRYIVNGRTSRSHASIRMIKAILEITQEKLNYTLEATKDILNSLDNREEK